MTLRPTLALASVAATLAACGTPQQQCINAQTRELRTVERLIGEAEQNLARGYAYETREITRPEWVVCGYTEVPPPAPGAPAPQPKPRYCFDEVTESVREEVAIDPLVEQRKLDGLVAKRRDLSARAAPAIAACRAQYPEES